MSIGTSQAIFLHQRLRQHPVASKVSLEKIRFTEIQEQDRKELWWAIFNNADQALEDKLKSLMN